MRILKLSLLVVVLLVIPLSAELLPETPFTSQLKWEVSAKAMGMGGAFTAISDNYAALYYNPAGLGQLEKSQVFGSFSQRNGQNKSTFFDVEQAQDHSYTKFDGLGLAIKVPTQRGSMVLSFAYNRVGAFDGALYVKDSDLILPFQFDTDEPFVDLQGLEQSYEWLQEGGLTQTSFGLSVEVAPKLFLGGAINFWGGEKEYFWRFEEIAGIWDNVKNPVTGEYFTVMIPDYLRKDIYRDRYSGANLSLGFLATPTPMVRIGGMVKSPLTLKGKRDWEWYDEEREYVYDESIQDYTMDQDIYYDEDDGYIEYKVQSPWIMRAGLAISYSLLTLSGDVEFNDYSQMKFKTDPAEDVFQTASDANRVIRREYQNTLNYFLGGELRISPMNGMLRGGLAHYQSPYASSEFKFDRDVYSIGLGFNFSEQMLLDAAYAFTEYENLPGEVITREKIKFSKFMATLTYQF